MKLIVGLGNPGEQYEKTRHNVGFMVVDAIAQKLGIQLEEKKFNGIYYKNKDFILAKPLTYMNNSGDFVQAIVEYYKINVDDVIIVYDDIDLILGKASIKQKGSSGGHNGMKDILNKVKHKDNEIKRFKIGIGRDNNIIDYVLGKFSYEEWLVINKAIDYAADALISFVYNDIRFVMNKFTGNF
ncbi:peptidyl-tRNA hydrolase [Metamycoplasma cloacale]|uniref:Peptidyl-tRNA hydrolase n=1 Tax=Metamycoplasma cloacale TaxID=92401 RepID=A0A2Z4LLI8_9BACT|nr:aminoacyl-tRNA hydrolase [Metamycoplasma cloacale]AWX42524.1 aminoacyl-tRNA hydrolase [Metamycoplasma cloacale]VEU79130.1 peptidyl-tRNA hydrolase [Metamycoplasma cloacale]